MQAKSSFHLLLTGFIITLAAALPLRGEEADSRTGGRVDRQTTSEDGIARELAALKQAVARLEMKIDRLSQRPSEFSRVVVRVVDEQGGPMSGFDVQLTSSDQAQRAKASGVSNEEGIALTRHLPYGSYRMSVSGNGWHTRDAVTVEVGKPLDLTIVAPTLDQVGELVLKASLPREPLEGLPFGGWKTKHDDGWGTLVAPEPPEVQEEGPVEVQEESSNRWTTFPTVPDGIETVAVVVELNIERHIEQPDGDRETWQWRPASGDEQQPYVRWLVQSDGILRPLLNAAEQSKEIDRQAAWFGAVATEDHNEERTIRPFQRKRLGYYYLKLGEEHRGQATLQLPGGQIELSIDDIYGLPSQDVLQAIDEPAEAAAGQLWLPAVVPGDSKWFGRLLSDSMTVNGPARGVAKDVELAADDTETVTVGSANAGN